eukprot:6197704-Pleurochrysis_carterae.AAC.7
MTPSPRRAVVLLDVAPRAPRVPARADEPARPGIRLRLQQRLVGNRRAHRAGAHAISRIPALDSCWGARCPLGITRTKECMALESHQL